MHNKALIADGRAAIVGGRNIGDHYYGVSGEANFRDMDVLATGPVVADIAASFDSFWNSESPCRSRPWDSPKQEKVAKRLSARRQRHPRGRRRNGCRHQRCCCPQPTICGRA